MLDFFREGVSALQQHFQGRDGLDAVDGLKTGIAVDLTDGLIWLIGRLPFTVL
ncbi:MAG: hypothetical protein AAF609_26565 [Cyanobacteria bacterium P01_C01_bin.120]